MKIIVCGIVLAVTLFFLLPMILPYYIGFVLWLVVVGTMIWYEKKQSFLRNNSLLNYRRMDPIDEKEKDQNDEALRILEKKYIEEKISKDEYLERKKEFEDVDDYSRKCKVCGSKEFDFVLEERIEKPGEHTSDIGYYKCKKCGNK